MIVTQSSDIWNILGYLQMEKKKNLYLPEAIFLKDGPTLAKDI